MNTSKRLSQNRLNSMFPIRFHTFILKNNNKTLIFISILEKLSAGINFDTKINQFMNFCQDFESIPTFEENELLRI